MLGVVTFLRVGVNDDADVSTSKNINNNIVENGDNIVDV